MTDTSAQMIILRLNVDGVETLMEVPFPIFEKLSTLNDMYQELADMGAPDQAIDLPSNVITPETMNLVVEYYQGFLDCANYTTENLMDWETAFFDKIGNQTFDTLQQLLPAANYLAASELLNKGCKYVARVIVKNRTVEELRDYFGVENDFTPEDEARIREEFSWAIDEESK